MYRERGVVEKGFDNLKNLLDVDRLCIHGVGAMEGWLFIVFVSQVLSSAVRKVMCSSGLDARYSLSELMNELKSIHSVRLDGQVASI